MPDSPLQLLLLDCGSRKFGDLCRLVTQCGHDWERVPFEEAVTIPHRPGAAILISGGPHLFTDPVREGSLRCHFGFLQEETRPIFGICLGFQALVWAGGGEIFRGPERRGTDLIRLTTPHPLTAGIESGTPFREDHCEGAVLPPGMLCLGTSAFYAAEIAADETRRRYGVQFHPEVSGEPGVRLLSNFFAMVRRGIRDGESCLQSSGITDGAARPPSSGSGSPRPPR